jgi:hypothetical protein
MATNASFSTNATNASIINPYSRAATQLRAAQLQLIYGELLPSSLPTNQVVAAGTMGIQSQKRMGAVMKCKKRGTKLKTKRPRLSAIHGVAFNSIEHCGVCKAKHLQASGIKTRVPNRAHHPACSKNRKTRGHSEETARAGKEATRNLAANRAAIANKIAETKSQKDSRFFGEPNRVTTTTATTTEQPSIATPTTAVTASASITAAIATAAIAASSAVSIADPTSLRRVLDERMKKLGSEGNDYCWLDEKKYPATIGLMVDYIATLVEHRKPTSTAAPAPETVAKNEALQKYRAFFRKGSFDFTFPIDINEENEPNPNPSPHYHSLEGQTILYVDWKLAYPKVELICYNCKHYHDKKVHLVHDRTNFSKRRTLFPIWTHSGLPTWCVLMNYKCEFCKTAYAANDGRLLSVLPAPVAAAYPVLPRYAAGQFHLHRDLSDDVEQLLRTYASGKFVSGKLHRKLGVVYARKVETYLSLSPTRGFVSYDAFTGGITPPNGAIIRSSFKEAESSKLTPYGFSHFERYEREMQSVNVSQDEKVAFDWTFQTIKNYNLPGANAVFTGNKGTTKEIITLAIVPTTAASQISHLLLQSREKRKEFKPAVLYTDTCPHNEQFWKAIFGTYLETKLGLFHLLHRIMDTLDSKSELYWKSVTNLRNAIYTYYPEDEAGLLRALKDGTFSKTGEKLSDDEIRQLRHSKRWKQRYSDFLRKLILPGATQRHRLELWIQQFKNKVDQTGKSVFTRNTEKVATEQLKKVHHASDVPGMEMYQEILPGKRSTHGLSKWRCDRPESPLEKFHELLAHFGNSGMNPELSDILELGGTTEFNVKMRYKYHQNNKKLAGESIDIPGEFTNLPRFFDHSFLHFLNELAQSKGLPIMFDNVHVISENNGEVFLSKYFKEQMVRNTTAGQDKKTAMCLCPTCMTYMPKNTLLLLARHNNDDNDSKNEDNNDNDKDGNNVDNDNSNDVTMLNLPVAPAVPPLFIRPSSAPGASFFVPPIPLSELTYGHWMPRPHDCCYLVGDHHCSTYAEYRHRKHSGMQVLGKPPHDKTCPVRRHLQR